MTMNLMRTLAWSGGRSRVGALVALGAHAQETQGQKGTTSGGAMRHAST